MIDDLGKIVENLNSPSDWAIVMGAATVGFVLDGAINIVPVPFFSPGICGLSAGSAAFSLKRTWDFGKQVKKEARRRHVLFVEARRCADELAKQGDKKGMEELRWNLELDGSDLQKLEGIVRDARLRVSQSDAAANIAISRGGFGLTRRRATNLDDD